MRTFHFDPKSHTPIVIALITGPKGTRKVRLIFDTGAEMTQFHQVTMSKLGYFTSSSIAKSKSMGSGGVESEGYVTTLQKLFVLGNKAEALPVGVYDMQFLQSLRIDGLLGWDVIRAFHLEMNGPEGLLRVF